MLVSIILLVISAIIVYLLFVQLVLYIDTGTNEYYVRVKGLMKANIMPHKEELIQIRIRAFFMNFYFYPINKIGTPIKPSTTKKLGIKKKRQLGFRKGLRLLRSFEVKRFYVELDTGNCITNAKLYPLFALLNQKSGNFRINFEGKNQLILHLQNRPIHILKSFINF
ncbi:hypothetical protein [Maribacter arenosus]|uniref:Uncharacterized protein n=1 Tax=Maribacter arenosus TaxID=1854708 RepID=A0ABR7V9J9_9FLAO|nr:hypothetical protein [Maribacter arenosus]MBD0849540.1 hypothetical protein [Maribacter arenosus]